MIGSFFVLRHISLLRHYFNFDLASGVDVGFVSVIPTCGVCGI